MKKVINSLLKRVVWASMGIGFAILLALSFSESALAANTVYYVDAVNGNDNNDGRSENSAWKTVNKVNSQTFEAGDQILFKRGDIFNGALAPKGSGASGNHIKLGAYGNGNLPIISAGTDVQYALALYNQEYWTIDSLEITGGYQCGIGVRGDWTNHNYRGYTITNCVVHGCYSPTGIFSYRDSGLIHFFLWHDAPGSQWHDILIENCTVYDTSQYNGIGIWGSVKTETRGSNITIRNNVSHDTGGVGIHVCVGSDVLIENNLVYNCGTDREQACTGFELWRTNNAVWQYNEAYNIKVTLSGQGNDNGCFDIDYFNNDILMQYNYGHDASGYGVAVLAANDADGNPNNDNDRIANNITVRYNIFANNDKWTNSADFSSVFLNVFNGGLLNGIKIYNNTIYHNAAWGKQPWAINMSGADFAKRSDFNGVPGRSYEESYFMNNIIYSTIPYMLGIKSESPVNFDNNIYYCTQGNITFDYITNGQYTTYRSLDEVRNGTGNDWNSKHTNPLLNNATYHGIGMQSAIWPFTPTDASPAIDAGANLRSLLGIDMGTRDYAGNSVPYGNGYDIGAIETRVSSAGSSQQGSQITEGIYKIKSQYSGLYMDNYGSADNGAAVNTYAGSESSNQQWQIVGTGDGYYKIINVTSKKALDNSSSDADGGAVIQWDDNGGYQQQWSFVRNSNGTYKLINRYSGKAIDSNWATQSGVALIQWADAGNESQQWILEAQGSDTGSDSTETIGLGYCKIKSAYSGLYMDNYGSADNGSAVNVYASSDSYNQQWQFVSVGDGYYKIVNRASGKVLDNSSSDSDNGAIIQWDDNGGNQQQWKVENLGDGRYKLVSRYSQKAIDSNWAAENGVALTQWSDTGNESQQWIIEMQ